MRPIVKLLLAAAAIAAASVPFWLGASPDRGEPVGTAQLPSAALSADVPRSFLPWPPFVLIWQVAGQRSQPSAASVLSSTFAESPCTALGDTDCLVRLAWDGFSRWSLTSSPDDPFDAEDPRQFTIGPTHYALEDGVVRGVISSDRLPPLHVCHRLLRARWAGEAVEVRHLGEDSSLSPPQSVLALQQAGGASAECLGPWGIPIQHAQGSQQWRPISLELRTPTDGEIGADLVQAEAQQRTGGSCSTESIPFSASEAGKWLLEIASHDAGYEAAPAGSGIVLSIPDVSGHRSGFAWVTADDPAVLPRGMRRHQLGEGLVSDEFLRPVPVVSVPVGPLRLWVTFAEDGAPSSDPERESFVLGEAAKRLVNAASGEPYRGALPVSQGNLPPGPARASSPSVTRAAAAIPDPQVWVPLPGQGDLPVWQSRDGGALLVLAGGSSFEVRVSDTAPDAAALLEAAGPVLKEAAACPLIGMPPQPPA